MYRKYREVRQSELPEGGLQVRCEKLRKHCTIFKRHPERHQLYYSTDIFSPTKAKNLSQKQSLI